MANDIAAFGYGYENPNDSASDLNAIAFVVRRLIAELDTMKLAKVTAVHAGEDLAAGTVDVQLLVSQIDGSGYVVPHGIVYGIPWWRQQGGTNAVICDPVVGDIGYVTVSDRDTTNVRKNKDQAPPGSRRKYSISDGIYVGGCLNVAPDQYLIFTETGVRLVDKSGNSATFDTAGVTVTSVGGSIIQLTKEAATISAGGSTVQIAGGAINITPKFGSLVNMTGTVAIKGDLELDGSLLLAGSIQDISGKQYAGSLSIDGDITAAQVTAHNAGAPVSLVEHVHVTQIPGEAATPYPPIDVQSTKPVT